MTFDPMHVFYVQGLFNHNAGLLFKSLKAEKSSITYSRAREFVSLWTLPHAMSKFNVLPVLERGETHLSDSTLKSTASEGLTLTLIFVNSAICPPPTPPCTRPHTFPWPSFGKLSACRNMPKASGRRLKKGNVLASQGRDGQRIWFDVHRVHLQRRWDRARASALRCVRAVVSYRGGHLRRA
jgi:hypothetical protein